MDYWYMLQCGSISELFQWIKKSGEKNSTCCKFLILWNLGDSKGWMGKIAKQYQKIFVHNIYAYFLDCGYSFTYIERDSYIRSHQTAHLKYMHTCMLIIF